MKKFATIFCVFALLFSVSCTADWQVRVESDTSWSGAFGNRTVDGTGNQVIDLEDGDVDCVVVQKETREGFLSIQVFSDGSGLLDPGQEKDKVTTTAEFGIVSDCTQ